MVTPIVEINSAALIDRHGTARTSDKLIEDTLIVEKMSDYSAPCRSPFQEPPDKGIIVSTIERFAPSDDLDAMTTALLRDGVIIVERAASCELIDELLDETRPFLEATAKGSDEFSGRNTRRCGSLVARSTASHQLVMHPTVLGICDRTLGVNSTTYQVHLTQIIDIGPGEPAQMLHRDQWAWDSFPFPAGFEVEISTIWATTNFTEENGATRVIPGSTRFANDHAVRHHHTVGAVMPKGSVVIYTGSVFHGGGANNSDERRAGVNIDYCLGWLRQEENQYLSCPPDAARGLPDDLLRLIGYSRAAYALGYFGDTQDPMEAVGRSATAGFGAPRSTS
jgi:Phytanoyl-CoA dioxygenase (PhyH)